ncbi:hypothetical protein HN51_047822 [Arachis hypogaea]
MEGGGATLSDVYQSAKKLLNTRDDVECLECLDYSASSDLSLSLSNDISQIQSLCVQMDRFWRSTAAKSQRDLWKRKLGSVCWEKEGIEGEKSIALRKTKSQIFTNSSVADRRDQEKKAYSKELKLQSAKQKEIAESEKEVSNRIRNLYKKEYAKKQSRQVRLCTKTPPSSKKRFWGDGPCYNVSNLMSNIMKKSKIEFLKR